MSNKLLEGIHNLRPGGSEDAAALLSMVAGAVMTSPAFLTIPAQLWLSGLLLGIGGLHFGKRLRDQYSKDASTVLKGSFEFKSAETPVNDPDRPGVLLGYTTDTGKPLTIPMSEFTRHMLVAGQSGVGKTVAASFMLYQQIQRGGGLMFVDGKVDIENQALMMRMARACGREQDRLFICPGTPDLSNTYNPILYGDPDEVASRILALMPSTENNPGSDYYKQASLQGVTTLVSAIQRTGLAYNFMDLSILLTSPKAMTDLEQMLKSVAPNSHEAKNLSIFLEQFKSPAKPGDPTLVLDMKKIKDVFGGVGGRLYQFGTGNFGKVLNSYSPDVRLDDAVKKNKIIYVALPTMGKGEAANNFGKMLMADIRTVVSWIQQASQNDRPMPPFMIMADEYGSYANVKDKIKFEQNRSANVTMIPIVQTFSSFDALSPEFSEMVIGNTWTKVIFKVGTQDTAERCADLIGMTKTVTKSVSTNMSASRSAAFLKTEPDHNAGTGAGLGLSERESEEYRVSPDDIKGLQIGEAIVLVGGERVYQIKVPMINLPGSGDPREEIRVNQFRPKYVQGLDLFKKYDKYITAIHGDGERNRR